MPTLELVSAKLTDEILWTEYAKMRALKKSQTGDTEIDIFDQFMTEQYLNQKEKSKFDTVKDPSSGGSRSFLDHCNNCSGYGHQSSIFFQTSFHHQNLQIGVKKVANHSRQGRLLITSI